MLPTVPGTILTLRYLGRNESVTDGGYAVAVYYIRYYSAVDGGCTQAAKLFLPIGRPPERGWPASLWSHGLGDPAKQLRRWPLVGRDWRVTRGELAGRWAHDGFLTLCPWLPGDGPSEPLGTYSPLSLKRNSQALADGLQALGNLDRAMQDRVILPNGQLGPQVDTTRLVLRTDCVSTPLLVYFAAQLADYPAAAGLVALVADDFQPSFAYNETYLGPFVCRLPPFPAAGVRAIWLRLVWALCCHQGWSLDEFFSPQAIQLFSQLHETPVGPLSRMMASILVPPQQSELAGDIVTAATNDLGQTPTGREIRDWLYSASMAQLAQTTDIHEYVRSPFYQQYVAGTDPFFTETITPFQPGLPLLVVPRAGRDPVSADGLPGYSKRYRHMTLPKIQTLRSWGWDIRVFPARQGQGTSFSGGAAQQWMLGCLADLFRGSQPAGMAGHGP